MTEDRRFPARPILGVGALIIADARILLVERGREPLRGYWSLPGGVVEVGESLRAAVIREVLEETGLDVEPVSVIEIFERIMRDAAGLPEYHYVLIDYLCRPLSGVLGAADDAAGAAWFSLPELASLKLTEGTLPVIEKAFAACHEEARPAWRE